MVEPKPVSADRRADYRHRIGVLEGDLALMRSGYLQATGWTYTSSTPDFGWRWRKEIDGQTYLLSEADALSIQEGLDRDLK